LQQPVFTKVLLNTSGILEGGLEQRGCVMRHIKLLFAFLSLLTGAMMTEVVYANPPYID